MQIFFPPEWLMITLFFVLWFVFQAGAAALCFRMSRSFFENDSWLFRTRTWERGGTVYERIFKVRSWKGFLPDGGALFKKGYAKKHLQDFGSDNLGAFIAESRRAELTHWLAILPFWVFGLFAPWYVIPIMLVYALAVNLPCIIAQRFNRPRVQKMAKKRRGAEVAR